MTRSISSVRTTVRLMLAACMAAAIPESALAGVEVNWVNEELYQFEITHVPDFDQVRSALPNEGRAYCVPTSAVNWAAYFANHGLPDLPPGPGYWEAPFMYDKATDAIWGMGLAM
ncbi:MAG: hypothetical protein JSV91_14220, partial [Phycisphaerales bacterium]